MKKILIGLGSILMVTVFLLTGMFVQKARACQSFQWGCWDTNQSTFINEQNYIDQNQKKLDSIEPLPNMSDSQERKNGIRRANVFNNANKISYIYLYSTAGVFIMYDTVKGKVSAVDSSLTAQQQLVDAQGQQVSDTNQCGSYGCHLVPAPAIDGSYGTNGNAIFWFNESGAYREWNGMYFLSDQPFTPQTPANLVGK